MQGEYPAATLGLRPASVARHYSSTSIALPCTHKSPHLVNVSVITVAKWRKLEAQRDHRGKMSKKCLINKEHEEEL